MTQLDPKTTALVLIDLQEGILAMPRQPRSSADVVAAAKTTAAAFRAAGSPVVLVHVDFAGDYADAPRQPVDQPMPRPEGGLPANFATFAEGLQQPGDITVLKRQWGAFYGTALDLHLRRRGITTLVLGGIATNFGVESTAREAWERSYDVVILEDLCATHSADLHDVAIHHILPRIARVRQSTDILLK